MHVPLRIHVLWGSWFCRGSRSSMGRIWSTPVTTYQRLTHMCERVQIPNLQVFWFQNPSKVWYVELGTSNVGYDLWIVWEQEQAAPGRSDYALERMHLNSSCEQSLPLITNSPNPLITNVSPICRLFYTWGIYS